MLIGGMEMCELWTLKNASAAKHALPLAPSRRAGQSGIFRKIIPRNAICVQLQHSGMNGAARAGSRHV
jgi:hypothetical protein